MVNDLKESKFLAGLNKEVFGIRFREVHYGDSGEECGGFIGFECTELFYCWFGQDYHGFWRVFG